MKASRSSLSDTRQSLSSGWIGMVKKPSFMDALVLYLMACGIDGRAGAAGNDQRRAAEEELVDLVLGAVLGQLLQIEHLAHVEAHGRDHHPVPGLVDVRGLVGPHLHAPGVGAHAGHLLLVQPVAALELEARRIAAGIAAPLAALVAGLHLAGAHDARNRPCGSRTFCAAAQASRSSLEMPSPSLSVSTPFQRAMSSSTPRPTSLSLACSMPSLESPLQSTALA